jgi:hypothetical protein
LFDYDGDVLSGPDRHRREIPVIELRRGLVLEVVDDGWVGEVVGVRGGRVLLRDRRGRERGFAIDRPFRLDDRTVRLQLPQKAPVAAPEETASGSSRLVHDARVARASRIWVEGVHDAELLELIWGDDLRAEGIVVEPLGGIDHLDVQVTDFGPGPDRRLGVLVDHLLPGTKEHRIASQMARPHVLVTGHPFVDVWAAVKPDVAGLSAWPDVPRGIPWKDGVCRAVGAADPATFWRGLLGRVSRYTDLDRSLVGAVESLIDFVTEDQS